MKIYWGVIFVSDSVPIVNVYCCCQAPTHWGFLNNPINIQPNTSPVCKRIWWGQLAFKIEIKENLFLLFLNMKKVAQKRENIGSFEKEGKYLSLLKLLKWNLFVKVSWQIPVVRTNAPFWSVLIYSSTNSVRKCMRRPVDHLNTKWLQLQCLNVCCDMECSGFEWRVCSGLQSFWFYSALLSVVQSSSTPKALHNSKYYWHL